ncbi:GreA/GreB family elongation factor [Haloechinothrix salitolerans]|uniref:GreA/GreB family elongation factor n=1 Tax=Haloechinothrix salitolerans TaxID=926830 RepID=A0ABW2C5I4_9PSEU
MSSHEALGPATVRAAEEQAELDWLRKENALLRTERDILLRDATGFAEDANATLLRRTSAVAMSHNQPTRSSTTRNSTMTETHHVWLTHDAHQRLQDELAMLLGQHPHEVDDPDGAHTLDSDPEFISDASRRRARIRQIRDLLDDAVVGQVPPDDGIAEPGMVLTVRYDGEDEIETFLLGTRDGAGLDGLEVYSPESPLGQALSGARQGDRRMYRVPAGGIVRVTLLRAVPYGQHAPATGQAPIAPRRRGLSASDGTQT